MTRAQIKKLVKKELFRRIDKGGTCFDRWIDNIAMATKNVAEVLIKRKSKTTTKQELAAYADAVEKVVGLFLEKMEVRSETASDNTSV